VAEARLPPSSLSAPSADAPKENIYLGAFSAIYAFQSHERVPQDMGEETGYADSIPLLARPQTV